MKTLNIYSNTAGAKSIPAPCNAGLKSLQPVTRPKPLLISALIPLVLVSLASAVPAQAQTEGGKFELSPFVGYHTFESEQNLEDSFTYGLRLGYNLTRHWALEGAVSFVDSNVDDTFLTATRKGQFSSPTTDVDVTMYQLDALYHFRPQSKLSPFLVLGYGATDYSPSISDDDMSTFNFGAGAKYWLADNVAVRFDLRDHIVSEVFNDSFHNISASLGITIAFGGKAKSTPSYAAAQQPRPAPRPVVAQAEKVIALEFEDIHFDYDQSTLTAEAKTILQRSVTSLKNNPKTRVRIAGYTSASGTAAHNQALSERRATAIKDYLVANGVSTGRLSTIGYGDSRPASYEATPGDLDSVAAKENMRALFEIIIQ